MLPLIIETNIIKPVLQVGPNS